MALTKVPSNLDATVATTQSASDNSTNVATTAYVTTAISNLSDSAPAALNTLNEIAAALGDDANYASTTTAAIAAKAPLATPQFTNRVGIGVAAHGTAALNITSTAQHMRLNNGSELGILSLESDGALRVWSHGDSSNEIEFYQGSGSGYEVAKFTADGWFNSSANVATDNPPDSAGLFLGWNHSNGAGESHIVFNKGAGSLGGLRFSDNSGNGSLVELMRLENTGALGIGKIPPPGLHTSWSQLFLGEKGSVISEKANSGGLYGTWLTDNMYVKQSTGAFANITADESSAYRQEGGIHQWFTQASGSADAAITLSERMRVNSSGYLLVGKTDSSFTTNGTEIRGGNLGARVIRSNAEPMVLHRQGSDGEILNLYKDSTQVGSIGTDATDIYIGTTDTGIRFNDAVNGVLPYNTSSGQTDNTIDLGFSTVRWRDLFLSRNIQMGGNLDVVGQIGAYNNPGSAWGTMGFRATDYTFKNAGGTIKVAINSNGLEIADGKRIVTKTTSGEAIRFERSSDSLRYSSIDVNSTDAGGAFIKLKVHTGASATSLADVITARGNGYVDMAGTSDVRVTIGSQGTAGTNDSNWIRGDASVLMYNSAGSDHRWEIGGTQHMELKANQSASVPMLSLTDAHPWIDMVAPDNSTWKSGITMRGGSSSTQAQCHFHMTRDSGFRTLSTAGDYDAYIDTTTANSAAYGDFLIGTDNVERSRITAYGAWQFYAKHQGDSVGHFIFSNQIGGDSTSANCTLMVKNGNCQVQIMPWSTLGARIGTRGGGWNSNSNNDVHFTRNDGMQIKLGGSGPVLSNGTAISSDERLKKNITDIADGQLAKINALKVRTFEWKNTDTMYAGTQEGFIAQEVESVIPEAVKEETMAPDPHDTSRDFEGDVKLLKHEVINARLIKAVQELSSELEAAKARIAALEG